MLNAINPYVPTEEIESRPYVRIPGTSIIVLRNQSSPREKDNNDSSFQYRAEKAERFPPAYRADKQNMPTSHSADNNASVDVGEAETLSLLRVIDKDDFIAGETSNTEMFIKGIAEANGWETTVNWLQQVTCRYFENSDVITGIIHAISHFDYLDMDPGGIILALGVLRHKNIYVVDHAIRAFENWNSKKAITVLESLICEAEWQRQYVNEVLTVLRTEGIE